MNVVIALSYNKLYLSSQGYKYFGFDPETLWYEAKQNGETEFVCWGDGSPKREFLYIDDLAEACYVCMKMYDSAEIINIESSEDITVIAIYRVFSNGQHNSDSYFIKEKEKSGKIRKIPKNPARGRTLSTCQQAIGLLYRQQKVDVQQLM